MHSKVLTCRVSSHYDFNKEECWLNEFKNKIDNDSDVRKISTNKDREQKESTLSEHCINLLLYAITNKKTLPANSIFDYINDTDNKGNLRKGFFSACGTYFRNDKYKGDAYRIITFLREKNILKDFLKEYLNDKLSEKLSSKNEETNQYLCANKVIFYALCKKHKIDKRKFINFAVTYMPSIALMWISICIGHMVYHGLSISEILTQPEVIFTMCAALGLLLLGIAASIWLYYAENNIPVEKMQQKLDAEQNSHCTASSEDMEAEEQEPSTVLEIYVPPIKVSKWTLLDMFE